MTKIFIVEDHMIVVEGLYSLLEGQKGIEIVGYANNGNNCLQYFANHTADVILMDINLPDMSGVDLCRVIKNKYPGIMILALSTFNQGSYIRSMMESGASGYLSKNAEKHEIITAIREVEKDKTYLSFEAGRAMQSDMQEHNRISPLTKREKEVLCCIVEGLTNTQIASKLFISIATVDSHRKNLHTKLNVKNTAMLVRFAIENKLV